MSLIGPKRAGYNDPDDPGNGPKYHTGKPCIEAGCDKPAGTAWSTFWCFECNVKRIDRITRNLEALASKAEAGD